MKDKSYSARAIENVINMRKKYIGYINYEDLDLDKMKNIDSKAEEDKAFREKYSNKRW